jgi:hypothetical protein
MKNQKILNIIKSTNIKINSNVFLLLLYYSITITILSYIFHLIGKTQNSWSSLRFTESIYLGIFLGLFHRYVLIPKDLTFIKRVIIGSILFIVTVILFTIIMRFFF